MAPNNQHSRNFSRPLNASGSVHSRSSSQSSSGSLRGAPDNGESHEEGLTPMPPATLSQQSGSDPAVGPTSPIRSNSRRVSFAATLLESPPLNDLSSSMATAPFPPRRSSLQPSGPSPMPSSASTPNFSSPISSSRSGKDRKRQSSQIAPFSSGTFIAPIDEAEDVPPMMGSVSSPSLSSPLDSNAPNAVRRPSLAPNSQNHPGQGRRRSSFNPFDRSFRRVRQASEVGPMDRQPSVSNRESDSVPTHPPPNNPSTTFNNPFATPAGSSSESLSQPEVRPPPEAHVRSRSLGSMSFAGFKNPFRSGSEGFLEPDPRRASAPLTRRPSLYKRSMSVVSTIVPENPVPQRYRSKSVCTLGFYLSSSKKSNHTLPLFEENIEEQKENMQEYLAAIERLQATKTRKPWERNLFKFVYFISILLLVYFVFIGQPIWPGVGVLYYRWVRTAGLKNIGVIVFMSWATFIAFLPLLGTRFEQEVDSVENRDASETALIIPAYKAALVLPETIKAALKIFKPEQIFVIANGNSETPLDNAADVCKEFGVNHAWVPIGSKITAEFIGVSLTRSYKYIMLIDDDVHLPPNLPLVTDRINDQTKCIGYTIKSTGVNGARGTFIQQCQDVEYKLSGLTRTFAGKYGSATFPHGAIILWEREVLQNLFNVHPGYVISEDWYFGHAARSSGYRIEFCSQVFVETETPPALFRDTSAARGGYGEMTVFKQRFTRWNFFYTVRIWDDTVYMLLSWRLGWREIVTKLYVTVELYNCILSYLRPFIMVITIIAAWKLLLQMAAITTGMYICAFSLFNTWHLRKKKEMVQWKVLPFYLGMKFCLLWVNSLSVYHALWVYARYFSVRHPRVIESRKALEAAWNVRLGTQLVPLDTHMGEQVLPVPQMVEDMDEIRAGGGGVVFDEAVFDEKNVVV